MTNYNDGVPKGDRGFKGLPGMPFNVTGFVKRISQLPDPETVNKNSIYLMENFTELEKFGTHSYDIYYLISDDNDRKIYYRYGKLIQY